MQMCLVRKQKLYSWVDTENMWAGYEVYKASEWI